MFLEYVKSLDEWVPETLVHGNDASQPSELNGNLPTPFFIHPHLFHQSGEVMSLKKSSWHGFLALRE
jgi:hypothetical protein